MEFSKLKNDEMALMADLIRRDAEGRDPELAASLRRIEIEAEGRHGAGQPDLRVTMTIAPGVEAAIVGPQVDRSASAAIVLDHVEAFVAAAERIFDDRHGTIEMLSEVRATLSREIAKARRRGLPYRTRRVSLTPSRTRSHDLPAVSIEIEVLGPLLDLGSFHFTAESTEEVKSAFAGMREKQERRLVMRDHLRSVGAEAMVDPITLAALQDAGICPAAAIADLRGSDIGIIDVDIRHGPMPLYIRDCVVTGNVPLGNGMRWQDGRLTVPKDQRASIRGLRGKFLKNVIAHDFFEDSLRIEFASEFSDHVWLHLHPEPIPLSLAPAKAAA